MESQLKRSNGAEPADSEHESESQSKRVRIENELPATLTQHITMEKSPDIVKKTVCDIVEYMRKFELGDATYDYILAEGDFDRLVSHSRRPTKYQSITDSLDIEVDVNEVLRCRHEEDEDLKDKNLFLQKVNFIINGAKRAGRHNFYGMFYGSFAIVQGKFTSTLFNPDVFGATFEEINLQLRKNIQIRPSKGLIKFVTVDPATNKMITMYKEGEYFFKKEESFWVSLTDFYFKYSRNTLYAYASISNIIDSVVLESKNK